MINYLFHVWNEMSRNCSFNMWVSAALLMFNQKQIYLFGQIQASQIGQPYMGYFPLQSKWVFSHSLLWSTQRSVNLRVELCFVLGSWWRLFRTPKSSWRSGTIRRAGTSPSRSPSTRRSSWTLVSFSKLLLFHLAVSGLFFTLLCTLQNNHHALQSAVWLDLTIFQMSRQQISIQK